MREVTKEQAIAAFRTVGVQPGDGLLVHSALQMLGRPVGGPGMYLDALQEVMGAEGTVAVPTFNFGFARGQDYDPQTTPSEGMGVFSEFVRQHPDALRTTNPIQSLAIIGKYAEMLAALDTPYAFDDGSVFDRIVRLGFKLLLLGADIQAASIFHYSEQRANVPYRYWKDFTGRIRLNGEWQTRTYRRFVRDLKLDPQIVIYPMRHEMEKKGQWKSVRLNYGEISLCTLADFVAVADAFLAADPWVFVVNRPPDP